MVKKTSRSAKTKRSLPKTYAAVIAIIGIIIVNSKTSVASDNSASSSPPIDSSSSFSSSSSAPKDASFYDLTVLDVSGRQVALEKFRGKTTLVVNVASECGYTENHYHELVEMREVFKDYNFEVLGFPCNQFGGQEPAPSKMVQRFVKSFYKAEFPIFHKIDVKGPEASPVYQFLTSESGREPTWNFWKYLVDEEGHVIDAWGPEVRVFDLYNMIQRRIQSESFGSGRGQRQSDKQEL